MQTEQRTVYIAKDNSEHRTEIEALAQEAKLDLHAWCEANLYRDISVNDIAETMIEHANDLAPLIEALRKSSVARG